MPSDSSTTGSTSARTDQETSTDAPDAVASTSTSILPEHALAGMRKTVRRASSRMAGAAGRSAAPEAPTEKLEKYGGDRDKLTPAQARRLRKVERRG